MSENIHSFCEIIVNSETAVLNLLLDGVVIGCVTYNQKEKGLYNLAIDIKHRKNGNAERLLREAVFRYQPRTITASSCYGSDVLGLIRLYEKVGFHLDDVKMFYGCNA